MLGLNARTARVVWTVAVVALALCAVYFMRKTLFIFAVAVFIAYMIAPLVRRIDRRRPRRMPKVTSVAAAFVLVAAVVAVIAAWIGPQVTAQSSQLASELPKLVQKVNANELPMPQFLEPYRARVSDTIRDSIEGVTSSAIPFARGVVQTIAAVASNAVYIVLIPILAFIFLKDGERLGNELVVWLRPLSSAVRVRGVLMELHEALGHYVRSLALLSLATFIAYTTFFTVTGVPFGVLLAALAALLEFIPVIGPLTAAAIAIIVALVTSFVHVVALLVFFIAYRLFQDYVLMPALMSGGVRLHPALVIFGFLAGEEIAGIPGMFLSIPAVASLVIIVRASARRDPALGDVVPDAPPPPVRTRRGAR